MTYTIDEIRELLIRYEMRENFELKGVLRALAELKVDGFLMREVVEEIANKQKDVKVLTSLKKLKL